MCEKVPTVILLAQLRFELARLFAAWDPRISLSGHDKPCQAHPMATDIISQITLTLVTCLTLVLFTLSESIIRISLGIIRSWSYFSTPDSAPSNVRQSPRLCSRANTRGNRKFGLKSSTKTNNSLFLQNISHTSSNMYIFVKTLEWWHITGGPHQPSDHESS